LIAAALADFLEREQGAGGQGNRGVEEGDIYNPWRQLNNFRIGEVNQE
jgi:hypothetical protein